MRGELLNFGCVAGSNPGISEALSALDIQIPPEKGLRGFGYILGVQIPSQQVEMDVYRAV